MIILVVEKVTVKIEHPFIILKQTTKHKRYRVEKGYLPKTYMKPSAIISQH